jgi:FkbM family methyltransferase
MVRTDTSVTVNKQELMFHTPNDFLIKRAKGLLTTEPETIAWINLMAPSEVLLDIGANVGTYSIYAASVKNLRVMSFEPEASNFSILNKNIRLNNCSDLVTAYPIAVGTENTFTKLYLAKDFEGWACNSIGQNLDPHLKQRKTVLAQGAICYGVDDICKKIDVSPSHIKVDIDGLELEVIKSAVNTLANIELKSLLVELNPTVDEHSETIKILRDCGFHYHKQMSEETKVKAGHFKNMNNFIFHRDKNELEDIYYEYKTTVGMV